MHIRGSRLKGVNAWHHYRLPANLRDWPQVLFEVDDKRVVEIYRRDGVSRGFFIIPGMIGDYVSSHVVKFLNVP